MENNSKEIIELRNEISAIKNKVMTLSTFTEDLRKSVRSIQFDNANYFTNTVNVEPGRGTKLTYNKYGQVISSDELSEDDIPDIDINKVKGLKDKFGAYASVDEVNRLYDLISRKLETGSASKTGTKISVDDNGKVVSVGNLSVDDLPSIPVEKINGIDELITKRYDSATPLLSAPDQFVVTPGTGVKINYDSHGRVTGSSNMDVDDLPQQILNDLSVLSDKIETLATKESLNQVKTELANKTDNISVTPGTYTKVEVNDNGQVTDGSTLSIEDLPKITIDDIDNLRTVLATFATVKQLGEILASVDRATSNILNTANNVNDTINHIGIYTDKTMELECKMDELQQLCVKISNADCDNVVMTEIAKLKSDNSILSSRIAILEKKLNNMEG